MTNASHAPLPRLAELPVTIWLHTGAMLGCVVLLAPFLACVDRSPGLHAVTYTLGLVLLSIGMGAAVLTPFSLETAVHVLGGFAVYLAALGCALLGSRLRTFARGDRPPAPALARCHVLGSYALLAGGLPFQLLTGTVALLRLTDTRLSGPRGAAAAAAALVGCFLTAAGYAHMAQRVSRDVGASVLVRMYGALVAENIGVTLAGAAAAMYVIYFELVSPGGDTQLAVAYLAFSVTVAAAGYAALLCLGSRARTGLLVPRCLLLGVPVAGTGAAVTALLLFAELVDAGQPHAPPPSAYVSTGFALTGGAVFVAVVARLALALRTTSAALTVLGLVAFARQRGLERIFADTPVAGQYLWWGLVLLAGTGLGAAIATRCNGGSAAVGEEEGGVTRSSGVGRGTRGATRRRAARGGSGGDAAADVDYTDAVDAVLAAGVDVEQEEDEEAAYDVAAAEKRAS